VHIVAAFCHIIFLKKLTFDPIKSGLSLRMETDQIHMELDSDNTFYHIFTQIRIQIRMFSNTNTKRMSQIQKRIRIST
jgi:hypothetical protein